MIQFGDREQKLGVPAAEVTSDVAKVISGLWPGPRTEERYKFREKLKFNGESEGLPFSLFTIITKKKKTKTKPWIWAG